MSAPAPDACDALIDTLPSLQRLALAYAPRRARLPTLALLALDTRLAGLLRHSREPMLAQLRLAWWRENLQRSPAHWPSGEPLLAALSSWKGRHNALVKLVDGWEALTGHAPLPAEALGQMAQGRAEAFAALAQVLDAPDEAPSAANLGRNWALCDLAMRLGHAEERAAAQELAKAHEAQPSRIARPLRPLLVLHGLARRRMELGSEAAAQSPAAMLLAMRLGLLGR